MIKEYPLEVQKLISNIIKLNSGTDPSSYTICHKLLSSWDSDRIRYAKEE